MTKFKKIIAGAAAAMIVAGVGTAAMASTNSMNLQPGEYYFSFNLGTMHASAKTARKEKMNNNSAAIITTTSGTLSSSHYINSYVVDAVHELKVSDLVCLDSYRSYTSTYDTDKGINGALYKLYGQTGYYDASVGGTWIP